jgi:CRP-like cAMP-binding protein
MSLQFSGRPTGNQLLDRLPRGDFERLIPHLQPIALEFRKVLYELHSSVEVVYFPIQGVLSAITTMSDGSAIEVATIGNEGMMGLPSFVEANTSPNRVLVQLPGHGLRMRASSLMDELDLKGPLHQLLVNYETAFIFYISQSVACNGLHPVQKRCCRWLLMTHDRMNSDTFPLTHEFLGIMLGVRRASVSEVLGPLSEAGLIHSGRGEIAILDRKGLESVSCECYRTVTSEFGRLLGNASAA